MYSYTYDAEGKVLTAASSTTNASYVYNALDQRVQATANGVTEEYSYNAVGQCVSTWNPVNNSSTNGRIFWNGTQIAWRDSNAQTFFDHPN